MIETHDIHGTVSRLRSAFDEATAMFQAVGSSFGGTRQVKARPLPSLGLKDGIQLCRFSVAGNIETAAEPRS